MFGGRLLLCRIAKPFLEIQVRQIKCGSMCVFNELKFNNYFVQEYLFLLTFKDKYMLAGILFYVNNFPSYSFFVRFNYHKV